MSLSRRYNPRITEPKLQARWQQLGVYNYSDEANGPDYIIDTPPPTVSGHLHLGHVYSYSHADFFARFWRTNGRNVPYPMGYDDNGLPTERLVKRQLGIRASDIGRTAFISKCREVSLDYHHPGQTDPFNTENIANYHRYTKVLNNFLPRYR